MIEIDRPKLYSKLNPTAYKALESAATLAKLRGNPYIELAHWINQIFQAPDSDLHHIIKQFGLDTGKVTAQVGQFLEGLPRGSTSVALLSPAIDETVREAWVYATLLHSRVLVRTGDLVTAWLSTRSLSGAFHEMSSEFRKIKPEALANGFQEIVQGSPEADVLDPALSSGALPGESNGATSITGGKLDALSRFSIDLTEKARTGELDTIVGRDEEIRLLIDVLVRRRTNNPVLVGEAGVGKTAVVEGLAHRIAEGSVPPELKGVVLRALDVGLLQAGASVKGEFEQRLRSIIDEVQNSAKPVVLFIDEVHTLIGAGGQAGTGDAANLLKPALARGTLRTVAATTWGEYRKHIAKDPALERRFQPVYVAEPDEAKAILMMRHSVGHLEKHHRVQIMDSAIEAAVRLSMRFIPARQLPDKAVSLLDTACARVAVTYHGVPAAVESARRHIDALDCERDLLSRETRIGIEHGDRLGHIAAHLNEAKQNRDEIEVRWQRERGLVDQILQLRALLRAGGHVLDDKSSASVSQAGHQPPPTGAPVSHPDTELSEPDRAKALSELRSSQEELARVQGEAPLLFPAVEESTVASVVADWTGIPVGKMNRQNTEQVLGLAGTLERRVLGQKHALDQVAERIVTSRARLENPERPVAVFMFVGPSGTGKTETALALAEALYGGEQNLITINMSEFQEKHTVSTLKGSPPGYVGYGEGGVLTEAVRRRPHSVVLLDEVEKAHPDVNKIFFQVFDKGWMEDSEGRFINFKNTVIILTSNAAQQVIVNMCKDPAVRPDPAGLESALRVPLAKVFPDALLNRLMVVPFYPISSDLLQRIIHLNLARVERRVRDQYRIPFTYDPAAANLIAKRCAELERGARLIEATITTSMLPPIGREMLSRAMTGLPASRVHVGADGENFTYAFD